MMRLAPICEGNANNNNNQLLLFLFIVTFAIISTTFTEHSFNPSSSRRNCKCISSHKVQVWKVVRMITPVIQSFNLLIWRGGLKITIEFIFSCGTMDLLMEKGAILKRIIIVVVVV